MIEAKFLVNGEWHHREFDNVDDLEVFKKENSGNFTDFKMREKVAPVKRGYFRNILETRKNLKIIKSSPYASLELGLKLRKFIIFPLIAYLIYMAISLAINFKGIGVAGTVGRIVILIAMGTVCWKVYKTIPQAKKQIDYYKKYPHLINYCPVDTKETVDEILKKFEEKSNNKKEVKHGNTKSKGSPAPLVG